MKKQRSTSRPHRQLNLFKKDLRFFGGQILHGKRKGRRPLSTRDRIHLVMRSSWAMGQTSFLTSQNKKPIDTLIIRLARRYGITLYQRAIASNHLHLLVRIESRKSYQAFVRVLSSKIALLVMKGKSFKHFRTLLSQNQDSPRRGDGLNPEIQGKGQKFWQFRPFNRVLFWGRDFATCKSYVLQNTLEAVGFLTYKPRKNIYSKWIIESLKPTTS